MDQNKFLQNVQKDIIAFNGDEQARQFENASNATVAYTEQVKMLQQALSELNKGNYLKDINNSLMDFAREVYNLNIDEALKQKFLNMQASAGGAADQMKNHMRDIAEAVRDALDPNANPRKFTEALTEIVGSSNELTQSMKMLQDSVQKVREESGKDLNMPGADKIYEIVSKLSKEFIYLENGMQAFYKGIPNNFFDNLIKDTDSFSESIKKLSEAVNSNAGNISAGLSNMVDTKVSQDSGSLFLIKQIESAITSLGNSAGSHQGALSKIFNEITTLSNTAGSGFNSDAVSDYRENLESTFVQLEALRQKQDELKAALGDENKKDPATLTKDLVEYQVIQTKVYSSMQDIVRLTNTLDLNKTFDKKPVDELLNVLKSFGQEAITVNNTLNTMGINMPNQITPQSVSTTTNNIVGKTLGQKAVGLATNIAGPAQKMLNVAGIGGALSLSSLAGGMFSQDRIYGDLYANSSIYDMIAGHDNYSNDAHLAATSRGINLATRTNGMIDGFDIEAARRDLTKSVMGQYHQSDANSTADISKLSEMSVVFQKGLGISAGDMNSSINTFYKELNMTLPQTEYLMSKISSQAQAMNMPFDKHLKQVESLALQYRDMGLSVDDAVNAMNNLMNVQGLNAKDALNVANDIGKGIGSMDDGSAAFFGMSSGGFSNPFAAINSYRMGKWNSDGSVNDEWASQWGQIFADKNKMMASMGGGGEESQWILYNQYKQAGMSDKTSALLSQTNDAGKIRDILKGDGNSVNGATEISPQQIAFDESMKTITKRIEDASDNLSGVTQTLNSIKIMQEEGAKMMHESIKTTLEPVQSAVSGMTRMLDATDNWAKKLDWLGNVEEALTAATIALAIAMGTSSLMNIGKNVGGWFSRTATSVGGPTVTAANAARTATTATNTAGTAITAGGASSGALKTLSKIGTVAGIAGLGYGAYSASQDDTTPEDIGIKSNGSASQEMGMKVGHGLVDVISMIPGISREDAWKFLGNSSKAYDKMLGLSSSSDIPSGDGQILDSPFIKMYSNSINDQKDETKKNTEQAKYLTETSTALNMSVAELTKVIQDMPKTITNDINNRNGGVSLSDYQKYGEWNNLEATTKNAARIIGLNEGNYSSVNANDNGSMSVGMLQWHGSRAKGLLNAVKAYDPEQFADAPESLLRDLTYMSDKDWEKSRTAQGDEAAFIQSVLGTKSGQFIQNKLLSEDIAGYFKIGQNLGITDQKALTYFADLYNQGGNNAVDLVSGLKDKSLDGIYNASMNSSIFGSYKDRRKNTYRRITGEDQISTDTGTVYDSVSGGSSAQTSGSTLYGSSGFNAPISALYGNHSAFGSGIDMNWNTKGMYTKSISEADQGTFNNQAFAKEIGKQNINVYIQASDPNKYEEMSKFFQTKMDQAKKEWDAQAYQNKLQQ